MIGENSLGAPNNILVQACATSYGGGGGGASGSCHSAGGGGSSYHGHPQITSGATEEGAGVEGGGTTDPAYVADTNEGACVLLNNAGSVDFASPSAKDKLSLIHI